MKLSNKCRISLVALFIGAAAILAGCGGGGGSSAPGRSNMRINIELPRTAEQSSETISAYIEVVKYDYSGSESSYEETVADTTVTLTYSSSETSYGYTGSFLINNIPAGNNYVAKVTVSSAYAYRAAPQRSAAATTSYTFAHVGAIVDSITTGVTSNVSITATSTVKAVATIYYAYDQSAAMSNTSVITNSVKSSIGTAVNSLLADGTLYTSSFTRSSADPFVVSTWSGSMETSLQDILEEASLIDLTSPTVSSFSPASGATGVAYIQPYFKVIFNETMDGTVDLNDQTTLTASNFTLDIARSGGSSTTIDSTNALDYGTFSWTTTTNSTDTLKFTLKTQADLLEAGLFCLRPGATYTISNWTAPGNLKDAAGNLVSTTGLSTSGTFTTTTDSTAPTVSSFDPASGDQDVSYTQPTFKVVFSESMDTSINLNQDAYIVASGFTLDIARSGGGSTTIDDTNAGSYGTFSWTTTTVPNDTLAFQLRTQSALQGDGLYYLRAGSDYTVSNWTAPNTLVDLAGNAVSTSGLSTSGTFTTVSP